MSSALNLRLEGGSKARALPTAHRFWMNLVRGDGIRASQLATADCEIFGRTKERIRWDRLREVFGESREVAEAKVLTRRDLEALPAQALESVFGADEDASELDVLVMKKVEVDLGVIAGKLDVAIVMGGKDLRVKRVFYPQALAWALSGL